MSLDMTNTVISTITNSGIVGILAYVLITRIETKLDNLVKEIHELVIATEVAKH